MAIPLSQMFTVGAYVTRQKLKGRKQYPLVLMLEPLFRCNLSCAGCGKIQYPGHILRQRLTPDQCFRAVEEVGAPTVAIPGGEPLLHPEILDIVEGLVKRRKYVYLCTNALLLEENLHRFKPSKYLTFSVHMDGDREHHDRSICREGGYDIALNAIRSAVRRGFRVTTNTTVFEGADPLSLRKFFSDMMSEGVEGMMVSPGYSYEKAPDQHLFSGRERSQRLFRTLLSNRDPRWRFNMSMLFLEFLMGKRHLECKPWGMPSFSVFGWQRPCYLQQDGYADSYQELLESTDWSKYGYESGNKKCSNCMLHSGYEATAVDFTFTLPGIVATIKSMFSPLYTDRETLGLGIETLTAPLVQIAVPTNEASKTQQGVRVNKLQLEEGAERAFDYRGDVTLRLAGGQTLEGYVYDRQRAIDPKDTAVRLILKDTNERMSVILSEVEELHFSGRDMADGRSFAAWMAKHVDRKLVEDTLPSTRINPT